MRTSTTEPKAPEVLGASPALADRHGPSERGSRWGLLWILGALFVAIPSLTLPDQGQWLGVKAFVLEAAGILLAVWVVSQGEWTRDRVRHLLTAAPNVAVLLFLAWVGFSVARAELPQFARYEAMRHLGGGLLYFAILYGVSARRHLESCVGFLALAGSVAAAFAFIQAGQADPERLSGAFHNPQLLAAFLCLVFPLVLVASQQDKHEVRRIASQAALVVIAAGLLIARNRSAWFGALAAIVVLLLLHLFSRPADGDRPRLQKHQVVIPLLMVVLSVGLFLALSQRGTGLLRRAQTLTVLGNDVSFRWRQGMWDKSLRMIRDRPLLGWGVGAYPMQQALYFHADVPTRPQIQIAVLGRGLLENAHNTYLQLAAELGLPGLALYLGLFGAFFGTGLRALPRLRKGFRRSVLIAAMAAATAHLVSAIGSPAWEFAECSLFLWAVLAIGMVAAGVGNRGRTPRSSAREENGRM